MKSYLYFYIEISHENAKSNEPIQTFYSFYSDGTYEKALVYEENGEISHSLKSGTLMMKPMLLLQTFVKNKYNQLHCHPDTLDTNYYTFISHQPNGSIIHETSGYITEDFNEIISILP